MTFDNLQPILLLIQHRRFEMAMDELNKILAQNPQNADAHSLYAVCLTEQNDYGGAMESVGRA